MRGGSDQAFLDGGLLDVVAARGRPFRHGHAQAPTPLPLDDNASEVQGERRAETRSSYAEPQPSLAMHLKCIAKVLHFHCGLRIQWAIFYLSADNLVTALQCDSSPINLF